MELPADGIKNGIITLIDELRLHESRCQLIAQQLEKATVLLTEQRHEIERLQAALNPTEAMLPEAGQ